MKNLFKTRRTKIYLGIITSAVFAMAIALFANFKPSLFRNASAVNDYTITFNRENGGTGFSSGYSSSDQTNSSGHTNKGNPIPFVYRNVKSTSNKYCTIADGGYLYNTRVGDSGLTGIESVQVTFTGSLSLYSSKSTTFSGDAQSLTSGSALTIAANYDYFKLVASGETVIESITVYYTCTARSETSYYVKLNETSEVTSGDYLIVYETGSLALDLQTETDSANNGTSVTIENDKIESTATTNALAFTLDDSDGSLLAPCGKYITHTGGKNTLNFSSSAVGHDITIDDGVATVQVTDQSYHLRFNSNVSDMRFRYYTTAANIALFKLDGEPSSGGGQGGGEGGGEGGGGDVTPTQATYQHVFNAKPSTGNNVTLSGVAWNITATSLQGYNGNNYAGVQFGTKSTNGQITLTSSSAWGSDSEIADYYELTKIAEVRLWLNKGGGNVTPSVSIGGVDAISDGAIVVKKSDAGSDWSEATKVTFTPASNGDSGVVVIDVKSTVAGYICCIEIDCKSAAAQGPVSVSSVSLSQTAASITNETGVSLTATISPRNATNQNVTWSTSNGNIATVDQSGNVTGVAAGNATITVTTEDGGKTATCTVTVTMVVHVTSVSLNTNALALHPGENSSLTATVLPANASNKNVSWSTSNASYATVNNGSVTAVAPGTATITVTTEDGSKTATCTVTVTNIAVTGISLNKNSLTLNRPGSETLTATIAPSNASNKNVNWSSGNTNVATVSGGTVIAVGTGTTTITATSAADNTKYATCTVTVNPVNVSSVSLNKNALSLGVGAKETLTATVSPSNADNTNINWSTSDSAVATVSNGEVTGVAAGTATITARSAADNTKYATCSVTVTHVTDCTIDLTAQGFSNQQKITTVAESPFTLTFAQASGSSAPTYYTSGSSVRTYANNTLNVATSGSDKITKVVFTLGGTTTATPTTDVGSYDSSTKTWTGSATSITFTNASTGQYHYKTVTITVTPSTPVAATGVSLPATQEIGIGSTNVQIPLTYTPSNANTGLAVTWSKLSGGSSKITVDQSGRVSVDSSATTSDTATIRATLTSNSAYDDCVITVTEVQKAKYTVLLYLCGSTLEYDSDEKYLYGAATDDMGEILGASGDYKSDVNFVIETGGSNMWKTTYGVSKNKLEVRHVSGSSFVKDNPSTITSQGNMGEASTLQTFLEYGLTTYPADKTALILWDHGGAMTGVCCDDNYNMDALTAAEVKSAVSGALSNCGMSGQKLEWIGYDACLMGVADVASINSDYFNYMVASEESEPGDGWDYSTWVPTLYDNPTNTTAILESITTSYKDFYNSGQTTEPTLAAYDLSYMPAFTTAFENFANQLTSNNWSKLTTAFANSLQFGINSSNEYMYGIADMSSFLANVNSQISSLSSYTSAITTALGNLVIYNKYCSAYNSMTYKPCGICVFMAYTTNTQYYPYTYRSNYTTNDTKFTKWRNYNINNGEMYNDLS